MPTQSGDLSVEPDAIAVIPAEPGDNSAPSQPGVLALLGRTLLFSNEPYAIVRDGEHPGRRGAVIILVIVGLVALAQIIGYWLGSLTAPRLDSLQRLFYTTIVDLPWYAEQVRLDRAFASQFQGGYVAAWEGLRILLRYPTVTATGSSVMATVLTTFVNWFVFAVLAHWFGRWFGSPARFGQTLGVLALAYAPLLLLVIQIAPGAVAPTSLIFLLLLATKFLAIKSVHGLGSTQTLFVVLAPYVVVAVLALLILLYGGAYGIEQTPYLNDALKVQQFLSR